MIKAVLFDLDGTLLPMDQDNFVKDYLKNLTSKVAVKGYDPEQFMTAMFAGVTAMIKNDGGKKNEEAFWMAMTELLGESILDEMPVFEDYYQNYFKDSAKYCGFNSKSAEVVAALKADGLKVILATNPLFPPVATHERMRWAGLKPSDFEWITTYDNSTFTKPNLKYYESILAQFGYQPDECIMVGNDVGEDMVVTQIGMKSFLLTDCLLNKHQLDYAHYPQGNLEDCYQYIKNLTK